MSGKDITALLSNNEYAGRGIILGLDKAGKNAVIAYFLMGRSVNSRNRVFVENGDGLLIRAFDESKMEDPSLIIYSPILVSANNTIVTNGDQTDTIWKMGDFRAALATREYEPDEPNFTPRISAILYKDGSFEMSILKHRDGRCIREFFNFEGVDEGKAYFISTYQGDGNPLPTFAGEPIEVDMPAVEEVWAALNQDNKVSLYSNVNGEVKIFNKNLGD